MKSLGSKMDLFDIQELSHKCLGYPTNQKFDASVLSKYLNTHLNNVGDPWGGSTFALNTHVIERKVVCQFASLYHYDDENTWGYVTNGGTEGNMYGLYLAREMFPHSMLYFSDQTHYSVRKIAHILDMNYVIVKSQPDGAIDLLDFANLILQYRDRSAIVLVNIGTTMKGAIDDFVGVYDSIINNSIHSYYLHADAALLGMTQPFLRPPQWLKNFAKCVDSISVSGHKFIGMPFPSGVVLARRRHVDRIKSVVEYIGSNDTTISGSRNALSPILFNDALQNYDVIKKNVEYTESLTQYLVKNLPNAQNNSFSNTVYFRKPSNELCRKYMLAVEGDIAHIVVMPSVKKEVLDEFILNYGMDKVV